MVCNSNLLHIFALILQTENNYRNNLANFKTSFITL